MTWMHVAIVVGYVLVLLAVMALLHGAMLVYRDLYERREEECEQQMKSKARRMA
ncbi:MAG: hypothetical protein ACE14L_01960 [Terriglobales bacterium]